MQYIALIYFPEEDRAERQGEIWEQYGAFLEAASRRGAFKGGDALGPSSLSTRVQVRQGRRTILDGPFAETKEQLGGFMIFECEDLDEALDLAAQIPDAACGTIEVRPLAQYPECHNENAEWRK